jgi:hypothetical protein
MFSVGGAAGPGQRGADLIRSIGRRLRQPGHVTSIGVRVTQPDLHHRGQQPGLLMGQLPGPQYLYHVRTGQCVNVDPGQQHAQLRAGTISARPSGISCRTVTTRML